LIKRFRKEGLKMAVLKRLGVLSVAKLEAIIMFIMGLFIGIFYAIFSSAFDSIDPSLKPVMAGLGWMGIIIIPIVYGILGFVMGAVGAWAYNLLAKWVGGIELEIVKK
jgi:hypothetical protein